MSAGNSEWVFAYGSNMHVGNLRGWLAANEHHVDGIRRVEPALLAGYRLVWNFRSISRDGGAANIEPCAGRDLPGLALSIDTKTLLAIDQKEGHPRNYNRSSSRWGIQLRCGKEISAWVYVAVPERCSVKSVPPRRAYLELLLNAAKEHDLPEWYVAELEATATAD